MTPQYTFHLIANSHLDPVWLWDRREGTAAGVATVQTVLDLMDEDPELTYIRGECWLYELIEKEYPALFGRITRMVAAGRWDIVGGNYLQPDTNLTGTATMLHHFQRGQSYFQSRFGKQARVGWAADSFGHSGGMPALLAHAGLTSFAFFRPAAPQMPLKSPAFWWSSADGSKILTYRPMVAWYGCERNEAPRRLDEHLAAAARHPFKNVAVFYGLGDHGGGPTRRHLREIRAWAEQHPEVRVVHSGLHRFFDALGDEVRTHKLSLPEKHGELNYCFRGCYASAARIKFPYRRAEAACGDIERTTAALRAGLGLELPSPEEARTRVLFNSFHDILPGSAIERAMDEQVSSLHGTLDLIQDQTGGALRALARQIDTSVPAPQPDAPAAVPFLIWNPLPQPFSGVIQIESALDDRPIFSHTGEPERVVAEVRDANGRKITVQRMEPEHHFSRHLPWRWRAAIPVRVAGMGWNVVTIGLAKDQPRPRAKSKPFALPAPAALPRSLKVGKFHLQRNDKQGALQISYAGKPLLGAPGLHFVSVQDPFGPWGGHYEEPESHDLQTITHRWRLVDARVVDQGPLLTRVWARWRAGRSELDATFHLEPGQPTIQADVRVFWDEPRARLKMVLPGATEGRFEVPGGSVERTAGAGEVPGGRWVSARGPKCRFGFASDSLYGFDLGNGALRATIIRSGSYAKDIKDHSRETGPLDPVIDRGEYRFRFLLTADLSTLSQQARRLESPVAVMQVPPLPGRLPRRGGLLTVAPKNIDTVLLQVGQQSGDLSLVLQETAGRRTVVTLPTGPSSSTVVVLEPFALSPAITWQSPSNP